MYSYCLNGRKTSGSKKPRIAKTNKGKTFIEVCKCVIVKY